MEVNVKNNKNTNVQIGKGNVINEPSQVNKTKDDGDIENALLFIEKEINKNGSSVAKKLFDNFKKELQNHKPNESKLKKFWDGIIKLLPSLEKAINIGSIIAKIFSNINK